MLLITKMFSSIVITMSGFKNFKIIQISVYRVLFGCQGSHISSKVLSLETERGCRYRVRVHDATDHKKISSIVITMSGFKIFKIIQISVYRVRISENLVSLHERVPNLSISSINSAEVQLQPATREIRSLGLLLSPRSRAGVGFVNLLPSELFLCCFRFFIQSGSVSVEFHTLFARLDWQL